MTSKFKFGLIFAALGYAIVVTIGVQYLTLKTPSALEGLLYRRRAGSREWNRS